MDNTREMKLDGLNIQTIQELYPWEAWFGCKKSVKTLDGNINVGIPKAIQTGKKIRLKDKGFKDRKGQQGHQYVTMRIINPTDLTEEQALHYKALAEEK